VCPKIRREKVLSFREAGWRRRSALDKNGADECRR
jgi:hypothetical protein